MNGIYAKQVIITGLIIVSFDESVVKAAKSYQRRVISINTLCGCNYRTHKEYKEV